MPDTAVLLIIYNRPELTKKVMQAVRLAKPERLYIAADGPRPHIPADEQLCKNARKAAEEVIDWDCSVKTLYRNENLGCGKAVSGAISWFFSQEDEGIILEDDCLPHPDFFTFCKQMLDRYREHENIMHIGGTNFQEKKKCGPASYYFSAYVHVWGWASWKRAWRNYDFDISDVDAFIASKKLNHYFSRKIVRDYWSAIFRRMERHEIDTWDYQWVYAVWKKGAYAVIPQQNLVSNIGFGAGATHTTDQTVHSSMQTGPVGTIVHPDRVLQCKEADDYTFNKHYKPEDGPTLFTRTLGRLKRMFHEL
jgi:GT2 family glycosyltransferase